MGDRSKNALGKWLIRPVLSVAAGMLICGAPALSGEREARFVYSPSGTANLAHWNEKIVLDVAGGVRAHTILEAMSQVAFWAGIARTEVVFTLPVAGALPDSNEGALVNYFVFFDTDFDPDRKTLPVHVPQTAIDRFSRDLKILIDEELFPISKGCRIARHAKDDNETKAFVAIIDSRLDHEARMSCVEVAVISSFGLIPNIYSREYTVGAQQRNITVADYSEPITLLATSAACVKDAQEFDPSCAAAIAGDILGVKVR